MGAPPAQATGAQPLAPTGPARGYHLAAARGRHAGAVTVTALAHQLARLIGPLHGIVLRSRRRVTESRAAPRPRLLAQAPDLGPRQSPRLIWEGARARQCDGRTTRKTSTPA